MFNKLFNVFFNNYKRFFLIPIIVLIINLSIIGFNYYNTGSFFYSDSSIVGGVSFIFSTNKSIDIDDFESFLSNNLSTNDLNVVVLRDQLTNSITGYDIQTSNNIKKKDINNAINSYLNYELLDSDISFSTQSGNIGSNFLSQSGWLFLFSFILMSFVSFYYFRNILPSISITISTMMDIIGIIAVFDLFHISVSVATIGALLMMIGYSTDSDILLAINILKKDNDNLKYRLKKALKTELTMDLAAFVTFSLMYLLSSVFIIKHIAIVLLIGIFFDIIDTWLGNAAFQRMYKEWKNK